MLRFIATFVLVCSVVGIAAASTPVITVGSHQLQPNLAGQQVQVYVSGAALVQGLEFNVQIGDGLSGPVLQSVDILTGTIFANNNEGIFPGSYLNQHLAYYGTTTIETKDIGFGAGYVSTSGLLATLLIDTTGVSTGQFALKLVGTNEGTTNFAGVAAQISDGTLSVPEPLSATLMLAGAGIMMRRRRG